MSELRATGVLLWLRAALLGSIALLTGVVSHAAADGLLPSVAALVVLAGAATLAAAWVLRRRRSGLGLVGLAVLGQGVSHLALTMLAGHRGDVPGPAPLRVSTGAQTWDEALMGGYVEAPVRADLGWTSHLVDHVVDIGPLMVLAHLLGAVVLGAWLALGEGALWALLAFLGAELLTWLGGWPTVVAPRRIVAARDCLPLAGLRMRVLAVGSLTHRGPPPRVC